MFRLLPGIFDIVALPKKRARQKQIPHSVRDDKKRKEEKADSSRKSAMAQRSEPAKKRRVRNDKFVRWACVGTEGASSGGKRGKRGKTGASLRSGGQFC